jgi:RND family efflux transporter MFP subunit
LLLPLVILAAGCQRPGPTADAAGPEPHAESFTNWTVKTELFAEYMPLVAGQTSRFAVHLTRLDTFRPVAKGKVEIRLVAADGRVLSFRADGPSSPGIFGVDVRPAEAGEYRLAVHFDGDGIGDVHDVGEITVAAAKAAAVHEHGAGAEEKIAFTKEQQWALDFATAVIEDRTLRASIRVPAEVIPRSGGEAAVSVPFDGRLVGADLPVIGSLVTQGQVLASLLPPTSAPSDLSSLELARNEASLALQLARRDRERAERLVEVGAAPARRLDEARTAEATAASRLSAAETRIAQYDASSAAAINPHGVKLFALRAPITGVVVRTNAAPSANVRAGETLFTIVDADTVYVSATVPEAEFPNVRNLSGAELEIPGSARPRALTSLVSAGRVVDPQSRTFPIIYRVDNRDRSIAINQAVHVRLLTRESELSPAAPESALVDDGGRPVIFIQESGETFVRRPVKLGVREGGYVQILEGAFPGERVVVKGAHLIRLASLSTQAPAHGHVH